MKKGKIYIILAAFIIAAGFFILKYMSSEKEETISKQEVSGIAFLHSEIAESILLKKSFKPEKTEMPAAPVPAEPLIVKIPQPPEKIVLKEPVQEPEPEADLPEGPAPETEPVADPEAPAELTAETDKPVEEEKVGETDKPAEEKVAEILQPDEVSEQPEVETVVILKPAEETPEIESEESSEPEILDEVISTEPLFSVETPETKSFYSKRIFVSGKVLDSELSSFGWRKGEGDFTDIETDYAGEFGFYVPAEDISEQIHINISAEKTDGSKHEKNIVLFSKNVKPEITINKPYQSYKFGKFLVTEGKIDIPGHERYIQDLVKEAKISLFPAGIEDEISIGRDGSFRNIMVLENRNMDSSQKLIINISLKNYKSSTVSMELLKSRFDLVDYDIKAGNGLISVNWNDIPFESTYRLYFSDEKGEEKVYENISSPLMFSNLSNGKLYRLRLEALKTESGEIFKGADEKVLPLDPGYMKPSVTEEFQSIGVSWAGIKKAESYQLFRKSERTGDEKILFDRYEGTMFIDRDVSPADLYSYSVKPSGYITVRSLETEARPSTGGNKKIHFVISPDNSGSIRNTYILNNYAYLIKENEITVSEVTDILNPVYTGRIEEKAVSLSVDEKYCYIVSENEGLRIYDISDPSNPVPVIRKEQYKSDNIWSMYPYLFLNEPEKGLRVLNVENPASPERLALYNDFHFNRGSVAALGENIFLSAIDETGKAALFRVKNDGSLERNNLPVLGDELFRTYLCSAGEILFYASLSSRGKLSLYALNRNMDIISEDTVPVGEFEGLEFFKTSYDRVFFSVLKGNSVVFYNIDKNGKAGYFSSYDKKKDENISFCNDKNGYSYFLKSAANGSVFRVMTEGISYINNRFIYPDRVYDFYIGDKYVFAATESGIYYSDKNKFESKAVRLASGHYKEVWHNSSYTGAVDETDKYYIFSDIAKEPAVYPAGPLAGGKTVISETYAAVLVKNKGITIYKDIDKVPYLYASVDDEKIIDFAMFKRENEEYIVTVRKKEGDIYKITADGKTEVLFSFKEDSDIKGVYTGTGSDNYITVYTEKYISGKHYNSSSLETDVTVSRGNKNDMRLYGNILVEPDGERGVFIYKNTGDGPFLVSICPGIFSFDVKYYDGKIYSRSFNSIEEIIPVIPDWFE